MTSFTGLPEILLRHQLNIQRRHLPIIVKFAKVGEPGAIVLEQDLQDTQEWPDGDREFQNIN